MIILINRLIFTIGLFSADDKKRDEATDNLVGIMQCFQRDIVDFTELI